MRMQALDLFCGGGIASLGLIWAGFEVTGIDIEDHHENYPGRFVCTDVRELPFSIHDFDFIWASPPCQAFSTASAFSGSRKNHTPKIHENLIPLAREILSTHPYTCIENVPTAPMRRDVTLTGPTVGLNRIIRKRIFEISFYNEMFEKFGLFPIPQAEDAARFKRGEMVTITQRMCCPSHFYPRKKIGLPGRVGNAEAKEVMGIPPHYNFTNSEIGEAVPPQ